MGLVRVGRGVEGGLGVLCSEGDLGGAVGILRGVEGGVNKKDVLNGETSLFQVGFFFFNFFFPNSDACFFFFFFFFEDLSNWID